MSLISLLTSRKWKDKNGKTHKATRVTHPAEIPKDVCVVRSSHRKEVCACSTCQSVVRDEYRFRAADFVDYMSWDIVKPTHLVLR